MMTKTCGRCREVKPVDAFGKWSRAKDGLKTTCRACRSEEGRLRYRKGMSDPTWRARRRAYMRANYDPERSKAWYESRPAENLMLEAARSRARRLGLPCTIAASDIDIPGTCPVLGISMRRNKGGVTRKDNSPSLDRIIPALGYVPGNVRVISWRANNLKRDATLEELELIVADMRRIHGRTRAA